MTRDQIRDQMYEEFIGREAYEEDEGWSKEVWDAAWDASWKLRIDEAIAEWRNRE